MTSYGQKLGFDRRRQQSRLTLVGLSSEHHALAERLQGQVVRPNVQSLVQAAVGWIQHHDETRRHVEGLDRALLEGRLTEYLLNVGVRFDAEDYFEGRLRMGLALVSLEVPLSLIVCAVRFVQQRLIDRILSSASDPQLSAPLIDFTLRVMTLDISLISDTYRLAKVHHLVRSLEEQMSTTRRYRLKATRDGLTGVYNREHVLSLVDAALREAGETKAPLCLVMLDLDHFKQVNDRYGHPAGDAVLKEVSRMLRSALREDDVVGRYGGEEFLILLRGADLAVARRVTERLRQGVAARPIPASGQAIPMTVSQGLTQAHPEDTMTTLIARADAALYDAKREGRNRVVVTSRG